MTMNNVLMNAILAMDSYNRGYDAAIDLRPRDAFGNIVLDTQNNYEPMASDKDGVQVGTATIITNSTVKLAATDDDIGFYALAYNYNGETVISYRGTDEPVTVPKTVNVLGLDVLVDRYYGWSLAAGDLSSAQSLMAIDFYQTVQTETSTDISLTGHSLGGGLAGYIGALYDHDATVFDSMAFQLAAWLAHNTGVISPQSPLTQKIYGGGNIIPPLDYNGIEGYYIQGEVLDTALWFRDSFTDNGTVAEAHPLDLGANVNLNGVYDGVNLHSMSSMVIRLFADFGSATGGALATNWDSAAQYFWPVLYDAGFAQSIGMNLAGESLVSGGYDAILRGILAYSAIEHSATSVTVFGDTGIRAFYDDANELGKAITYSELNTQSVLLERYSDEISKVFINFSGLLALHKINHDAWVGNTSGYIPTDGVLSFVPNSHLIVNFDDALWTLAGGGISPDKVGQKALIDSILANTSTENDIRNAMTALWGNNTEDVFHKVFLDTYSGDATLLLPGGLNTPNEANLYVGTSRADDVKGAVGNDLLIGGQGSDVLRGSSGKDILIGTTYPDVLQDPEFDVADYSDVAAFLKVTSLGGQGNYTVDKYFNQTSATGDFVRDYLFSIEDIKGAIVSNGAGGITIDGAGGQVKYAQVGWSLWYDNPNTAYTMYGSNFAEQILGGNQADLIEGKQGDDNIDGGAGGDTFVYSAGDGNDLISQGTGNVTELDTLWFKSYVFSDLEIYRTISSAHQIFIDTPDGATIDVRWQMWNPIDYLKFSDGTIVDMETVLVPVYGTEGNDPNYLSGTQDNGAYREGASINDLIYGYGGNDNLSGGTGVDTLYGGDGNDSLDGGAGGDYLYGDAGIDVLSGADGDDFLYGGAGNDTIYGRNGNDTVDGGAGNDLLQDNNFSSEGGNGNDVYIEGYGSGLDTIHDTAGVDTIRFTDGISIETISVVSSGNDIKVVITPGTDEITITGFNQFTVNKIENLEFKDGSWANLSTYASWYKGTSGNDSITGSAGDDTIISGAGNDTSNGGAGNDLLFGGVGNDTVKGGDGNDFLYGGADIDYLEGNNGDDILYGGVGADSLKGSSGVDKFVYSSISDVGDTILDFSVSGGEKIDLMAILQNSAGFIGTQAFTAGYLRVAQNGTSTNVYLDVDGSGGSGVEVQLATLQNVTSTGVTLSSFILPTSVAGTSNTAPVAGNDNTSTNEDTAVTVSVLANDSDANGDALTVSVLTGATKGSLVVNANNTITYTPTANTNGLDSFTYQVNDGHGGTVSATVSLTVNAVNDAPVAANDSATTNEDTATILSVKSNDTDIDGDTLAVSVLTNPTHGAVVVNADNTISYTPTANYYGADSFTYQVNDGHGGTASASVSLTVNSLNDAPIAFDDVFSGTQNTNIIGNLLSNNGNGLDSDIDGDALSVTAQTFATAHGSVVISANGGFTYTPTTGYSGSDTFNYTLSDGHGGSDTGAALITVAASSGIYGTSGNDMITGTAADDNIYGLAGNDTLYGEVGNDTLYGDAGADTLKGRDGNDIMYGGADVDYLEGGNGDDILYGGAGADALKGSSGVDTFVFQSMSDAGDTIQDYNYSAGEKLNIANILTLYHPLTDAITDFVQITQSGTNSILSIDVDGGANSFVQLATLTATSGLTDEQALVNAGRLIVV